MKNFAPKKLMLLTITALTMSSATFAVQFNGANVNHVGNVNSTVSINVQANQAISSDRLCFDFSTLPGATATVAPQANTSADGSCWKTSKTTIQVNVSWTPTTCGTYTFKAKLNGTIEETHTIVVSGCTPPPAPCAVSLGTAPTTPSTLVTSAPCIGYGPILIGIEDANDFVVNSTVANDNGNGPVEYTFSCAGLNISQNGSNASTILDDILADANGNSVCYAVTVTAAQLGCISDVKTYTLKTRDIRCDQGGNAMDLNGGAKIALAHKQGNSKCKTICIDAADVADHIAHGDSYGPCGSSRISSEIADEEFVIFPNPSTGVVTITLVDFEAASSVIVTDMSGRVVLSKDFAAGMTTANVDLSGNAMGIYFLEVINGTQTQKSKIVLQ